MMRNNVLVKTFVAGACCAFGVVAIGCGDNLKALPDAAAGDAAMGDAAQPPVVVRALAAAGDFMNTGTLARLTLSTRVVEKNLATGAVDADPLIREIGNEVVVINRATNNITILDSKTLVLKEQFSAGSASNPQDVALVGDKVYVPALGSKGVLVFRRGDVTPEVIDLSSIDADGKPDCNSILHVGNQLVVSCGALNAMFVSQAGRVFVLNAQTEQVVAGLDLPKKNPFGQMVATPATSVFEGDVLVTTADFADQTNGCIVRVKVGDAPAVRGCATQYSALGTNPSQMAVAADGKSLFVVGQNFTTQAAKLQRIDLTTGMLDTAALSPAAQQLVDVATCSDGSVVVADTKPGASGLRVYKAGVEVTTAPLDIGLRPGSGSGLVCN